MTEMPEAQQNIPASLMVFAEKGGNVQGITQQEESYTRNGINALEQAFAAVQKSRWELENTKNNVGLGGSTGRSYDELLQLWDDQAEIISRNLQSMIDELNNTLRESGKTVGSANEQVNMEYQQSQSVFNALQG
ncbi:hypothetical protein AB0L99_21630 [Streptomyces sp. NPDC051954]|uniref:hypothetical protein n=1 Tax=unclassified Streptomyces TaxID=2593676 RepID=UPI00342792A0